MSSQTQSHGYALTIKTCRYNLSLSEDLRQVRTGRDLHTEVAMDDCESLTSHMMASANAMNDLYRQLQEADKHAKLEEYLCPKLFAGKCLDFFWLFCS